MGFSSDRENSVSHDPSTSPALDFVHSAIPITSIGILPMSLDHLAQRALQAREKAYAPYSKYRVGAALETADGTIIIGTNVENASYGLTVCAERVAVFTAVAQGHREFKAIAVATGNGGSPCGACRQVLREFAPSLPIAIVDAPGTYREVSLAELFPDSFGPESLGTS